MNDLNFIIKPYDPIDEAMQLFRTFNDRPEEREHTESQLTQLIVHRIKQHDLRQARGVSDRVSAGLVTATAGQA